MIRPRGGTTRRRDDDQDRAIASIDEIGRSLREAREEKGLDLLSVHDRLSRPITQIEALENGDLTKLPDQALAITTLRRYATFLGLDGDALALRMVDAWSVVDQHAPAGAGRAAVPLTSVMAAVTTGPDHLRAFTQTGQVPKVAGRTTAAARGAAAYDAEVAGPPTGTFPVVPRHEIRSSKRAVAKARRRLRAPTMLIVVTWFTAVLVLAALLGFAADLWHPQWLVQAHVLRVVQPGGTPAPAPTPGRPGAGHQVAVVVPGLSGPGSAAYTVDTAHFTVNLAVSGPCWVQVTSSAVPFPLASGVQPPGKFLTFAANGTMTVQVGSTAVLVGVVVNGKNVFLASPHQTPFTYTFAPPSKS